MKFTAKHQRRQRRLPAKRFDDPRLRKLLKEECLETAEEAKVIAKEFEPLDRESLKYLDSEWWPD